jgi:hypothetical protein
MPLLASAQDLIRANLEAIAAGNKARPVVIGELTPEQFTKLNEMKAAEGLPLLQNPEVVFIGLHLYNSRVIRDGYTIDDVLLQIEHALAATSQVRSSRKMTAMKSAIKRKDGYGNEVLDEAVFELTQRKPRAELYSVIPKGDKVQPKDLRSAA